MVRVKPISGERDEELLQLYREYETALLQYLKRMLGTLDLAREAAQETYARMQQMYRTQEILSPRALLFQIATNTALMRLRKARMEASVISGDAGMDEVPDESADPGRRARAAEAYQHLEAAVDALPPSLRDTFILTWVEGKPRKEVAEMLGIKMGRLDKRLTEALRKVRERLKAAGIDARSLD